MGGKVTFQIEGEHIPLDVLLNAERKVVNDKLVRLYAKEILDILFGPKRSVIRVWRNPDDPTEVRVIDGLHRLYAADFHNQQAIQSGHSDAVISELPCVVEEYSKDEFLRRRKEQTIAHGQIADFRCIDWLIDEYELPSTLERLRISKEQRVPLESILALYASPAKDKGRNLTYKYKITPEKLADIMGFVEGWISEYNVSGFTANDIFKVIWQIGREDIDILGLEGMKRDHIRLAYTELEKDKGRRMTPGTRRRYANHILRITAGTDAARGKVQMLCRVVATGTDRQREAILSAVQYYGDAERVYEEWKSSHEEEVVEQQRGANLSRSMRQGKLDDELIRKHYGDDLDIVDLDLPDPGASELDDTELEQIIFESQKLVPAARSPSRGGPKKRNGRPVANGGIPKIAPVNFAYQTHRALPGQLVWDYAQNGPVQIVFYDRIYLTADLPEGGWFARIDSPFLLKDEGSWQQARPRVYAAGMHNHFIILPKEGVAQDELDMYHFLEQQIPVKLGAGRVVGRTAAERPGLQGLMRLMREDCFFSTAHKGDVIATPYEVLVMIAGSEENLRDRLSRFSSSIVYDTSINLYRVADISMFRKMTDRLVIETR